MINTRQIVLLWILFGLIVGMPVQRGQADEPFAEPPEAQPIARETPFPEGTDPFTEGTDPFTEGTDPFTEGTDPFAEGTDPFAEGTDPFGEAVEPEAKPTDPATEPIVVDGGDPLEAAPAIGPRFIRLYMTDGSVIAGNLSSPHITVTTDYGPLQVPIDQIHRFRPGLNSHPELSAKIDKLFEDLGSTDFRAREEAYKKLLTYGHKLQNLLDRYDNDSNLERKNRVSKIRQEMDELEVTEDDEFDVASADKPWQRDDFVTTTKFTIVGKITDSSFEIASKYGPLKVKLSDVRHAERPQSGRTAVLKSVDVSGANLVQRVWKSTGVRVEKGDIIHVRADGQIMMTPWGNVQSTPDGSTQFGWYVQNKIPGGALCARIGDQGDTIKVGGRATFVAKRAGVLKFAVAMVHNYAQQNYNYPGQYNVKIKVRPQ